MTERAFASIEPAPGMAEPAVAGPREPLLALSPARVLALQRCAGNTAVSRLLQRDAITAEARRWYEHAAAEIRTQDIAATRRLLRRLIDAAD